MNSFNQDVQDHVDRQTQLDPIRKELRSLFEKYGEQDLEEAIQEFGYTMMIPNGLAYTKSGIDYPGYININETQDEIVITIREDPIIREKGCFVCGYEGDKGQYGRCTPGDENCNNYCNMAPEKGPMAPEPKETTMIFEGNTATLRLTKNEWTSLFK